MPFSNLDDSKSIPPDKINEFRKNGHTLIPDVINQTELEAYHPAIVDAANRYNTEKRKLEDRDTYGKAFLQIMNLWQRDEQVKKFVLAKRFANIAANLLGVDNVRLYHDQALFKEASGGPTPWHIDQYYWPLDTTNTITMWMPLVDITEGMGMLTFASGTHKEEVSFDHEISDESEEKISRYINENDILISQATTMNAGDATWHYGHTIHSAPGNQSDSTRQVMCIIYFADEARVTTPTNEQQENDRQTWLMSKEPGTLADSKLNPLLL